MKQTFDPEIAVLLPSYNPGPELAGTLDSLRAQTQPFRLFLVDDGSKFSVDYETLTHGMDARILRLPRNLGITGAMNAGLVSILAGTFSYVARIDAGDFCVPQRFEKQLAFMKANPAVGIAGSAVQFRLFDGNNTLIGEKTMVFPLSDAACVARLPLNSPIIHPAMMIRRAVFDKLKAYSEAYPAAEDLDLLWRAHLAGFKLVNLPETLLVKEETPGSISQRRRRKQLLSRLRIQWDNRNLFSSRCWVGMAKSIVTWALPASAVNALKFMKG
jgi:GT2 family glycosyltransferase